MGAASGTAARLCTVSQGCPLPCWATSSVPAAAGQGNIRRPPCGVAAQSIAWTATAPAAPGPAPAPAAPGGAVTATVRPVTAADSNLAENLSSASTPHRLAVVVDQAPWRCRPRLPTTRRGNSARQAGSSSTARIRRDALASALSINHHQWSPASVLKFSVVPAQVRRLRSTWRAAARRWSRSGTPSRRCRMASQSITAAVGHCCGVRFRLASQRGWARPWRARASIAASLRTSRSGLGDQNWRWMRPCTKAVRPSSIASRAAGGSATPASWLAASR